MTAVPLTMVFRIYTRENISLNNQEEGSTEQYEETGQSTWIKMSLATLSPCTS